MNKIKSIFISWVFLFELMSISVIFILTAVYYLPLAVFVGIFLFVYSSFFGWRAFKTKQYFRVIICILFGMFGFRFTILPITHNGFNYDKDSKIYYIPHEHYLWELDHVH